MEFFREVITQSIIWAVFIFLMGWLVDCTKSIFHKKMGGSENSTQATHKQTP